MTTTNKNLETLFKAQQELYNMVYNNIKMNFDPVNDRDNGNYFFQIIPHSANTVQIKYTIEDRRTHKIKTEDLNKFVIIDNNFNVIDTNDENYIYNLERVRQGYDFNIKDYLNGLVGPLGHQALFNIGIVHDTNIAQFGEYPSPESVGITMNWLYKHIAKKAKEYPKNGIFIDTFYQKLNGHKCSYEYNKDENKHYILLNYYMPIILAYDSKKRTEMYVRCGLRFKTTQPNIPIRSNAKVNQPQIMDLLPLMQQIQIGHLAHEAKIIQKYWETTQLLTDKREKENNLHNAVYALYWCLLHPYDDILAFHLAPQISKGGGWETKEHTFVSAEFLGKCWGVTPDYTQKGYAQVYLNNKTGKSMAQLFLDHHYESPRLTYTPYMLDLMIEMAIKYYDEHNIKHTKITPPKVDDWHYYTSQLRTDIFKIIGPTINPKLMELLIITLDNAYNWSGKREKVLPLLVGPFVLSNKTKTKKDIINDVVLLWQQMVSNLNYKWGEFEYEQYLELYNNTHPQTYPTPAVANKNMFKQLRKR